MTNKQQPEPPERIDLIAYNWAESLSQGEQDVLLTSSLKRLQGMINAARVHPVDDVRIEAIKERNKARRVLLSIRGSYDLQTAIWDIDYLVSSLPQLSSSEYQRGVDAVVRRIQQRRDRYATVQGRRVSVKCRLQ
jgi:hypothetical protein